MTPIKVTCILDGPIAGDVPMLDSLVEGAVSIHHVADMGLRHVDREGNFDSAPWLPGGMPTPIMSRRVDGFDWPIPLCSSPIFHVTSDTHAHYTRKFDVDVRHLGEHRVIASNMGEFKSNRLPLRLRTIDRVVWFCMVDGKPRNLRTLLKRTAHVGKKVSQGYGRVREWIVEPHADDWSWFAPSDAGDVLMRPLPASAAGHRTFIGARPWFGGIVPPYHDGRHFADGVVPC